MLIPSDYRGLSLPHGLNNNNDNMYWYEKCVTVPMSESMKSSGSKEFNITKKQKGEGHLKTQRAKSNVAAAISSDNPIPALSFSTPLVEPVDHAVAVPVPPELELPLPCSNTRMNFISKYALS